MNMKNSEFTERQIQEIYEFLEEYVPAEKLKARRELLSMLRYDRSIMKSRILAAQKKMLSEIDDVVKNDSK